MVGIDSSEKNLKYIYVQSLKHSRRLNTFATRCLIVKVRPKFPEAVPLLFSAETGKNKMAVAAICANILALLF